MPDVDVIIPCRAPVPWLAQSLQSCFQDVADIAVWVVDDGSADESVAECLRGLKDDRVHYLRQVAAGPSRARNAGRAAGASPWLLYLDADDYFLPGGIGLLLEAGRSVGGMILAGWQDVSADGCKILGVHTPQLGSAPDALGMIVRISPPLGPVLVPRTALAWDESRRVWEVTRYFNRVAAEIGLVTVISTCVAAMRQHDSVTRLTHSERHFAIDVTSAFWIEEYEWMRTLGLVGAGARRIVAERLLGLAYAAARGDDPCSVAAAASILSLARRDDWRAELRLRTGSAAWVATHFGWPGLRAFASLNRAVGR